MSVRAGFNATVTLQRPVYDTDGRAVDTGPSLAAVLGRATVYNLTTAQDIHDTTALGGEFRTFKGGLRSWDARLSLLWNAQNSTYNQDEVLSIFFPDVFSSRHQEQARLGVCLWIDAVAPAAKEVFYGCAVVESADVVTSEPDVIRFNVTLRGSDGLNYAEGLFTGGAFGVHEQITFAAMEAYTFAQLETLAEP